MSQAFQQYKNLFVIRATDGNQEILYRGVDPVIRLPAKRRYAIGLDPATRNTGIYIRSIDEANNKAMRKLRILIDISNKGLPNKEIFFRMMVELFNNIFQGINVGYVFIEEPYKDRAFSTAKEKLTEFRGLMNMLQIDVSAFEKSQFFFVQPGIWRRYFLSDSRHDGMRKERELLKIAAMEETICRYPKLEEYGRTKRTIPDSYDAVGVLEGGAEAMFYKNHWGLRRFSSTMKPLVSNYYSYYGKVSVCEESLEEFVIDFLSQGYSSSASRLIEERGLAVYVVDNVEDYSLDAIASSCVSETNKVCVIVYKSLDWTYDMLMARNKHVSLEKYEAFICVAWRTNPMKVDLSGESYIELPDLFCEG